MEVTKRDNRSLDYGSQVLLGVRELSTACRSFALISMKKALSPENQKHRTLNTLNPKP